MTNKSIILEDFIPKRIMQLRIQRGVSAREMSIALGQNPGYINNIETGKSFPKLAPLNYICDYFGITLGQFFDVENNAPDQLNKLMPKLKRLDSSQIAALEGIIDNYFEKEN